MHIQSQLLIWNLVRKGSGLYLRLPMGSMTGSNKQILGNKFPQILDEREKLAKKTAINGKKNTIWLSILALEKSYWLSIWRWYLF